MFTKFVNTMRCILLKKVKKMSSEQFLDQSPTLYTVFQKKWRQNSNHYNYSISYQN